MSRRPQSTGAVYGIDLGTTYSCLAAIDGTGRPQIVPQMDGSLTLPSVVLFIGADDFLTGEPARAQARALPEDVCTLAKRRMGDGEWRFVSHGKQWSAPAVSGLILRALVSNTAFNAPTAVQDVVITVPAYFGDEERRATRLAGEYAGLTVLDVISEPIAAALSYGFARLDGTSGSGTSGSTAGRDSVTEEVALVYDLGGGTFDVTVVELAQRRVAVVSIDGDHELGGADWDERLAVHLSRAFTAAHPDAEDPLDDSLGSQALILTAEQAKRDLTDALSATVTVNHDGHSAQVRVTREEFESLTRSLLDRTLELTRQAVRAAQTRGVSRVDRVLLVGGCSRMPAVAARLTQELGVPTQLADPDLAVAKGAAIYGDKKAIERLVEADLTTRGQLADGEPITSASPADLDAACARLAAVLGISAEQVRRTIEVHVLNVVSRGFGVMAVGMSGGLEAVFLVHRNDRLPIAVRRSFGTMYDDQEIVTLRVIEQGGGAESADPNLSKLIAEMSITDIPPGHPAGTEIEITLAMGFDGILKLTALHEGLADRLLKAEVETSAALSQADVARERAQVARARHGKPQ